MQNRNAYRLHRWSQEKPLKKVEIEKEKMEKFKKISVTCLAIPRILSLLRERQFYFLQRSARSDLGSRGYVGRQGVRDTRKKVEAIVQQICKMNEKHRI